MCEHVYHTTLHNMALLGQQVAQRGAALLGFAATSSLGWCCLITYISDTSATPR